MTLHTRSCVLKTTLSREVGGLLAVDQPWLHRGQHRPLLAVNSSSLQPEAAVKAANTEKHPQSESVTAAAPLMK